MVPIRPESARDPCTKRVHEAGAGAMRVQTYQAPRPLIVAGRGGRRSWREAAGHGRAPGTNVATMIDVRAQ